MNKIILGLACALLVTMATAQEPPAPPAPPPLDCTPAEHQQFDFWIGEWAVSTADGQLAGHNTIEPTLNGCALTEFWRSTSGGEGRSINFYDRSNQQWHQLWVDSTGWSLRLAGTWNGKAMVLGGTTAGPDGSNFQHRVTWTPLQDGSVQQHWESSRDNGLSWSTVFDGNYRNNR